MYTKKGQVFISNVNQSFNITAQTNAVYFSNNVRLKYLQPSSNNDGKHTCSVAYGFPASRTVSIQGLNLHNFSESIPSGKVWRFK